MGGAFAPESSDLPAALRPSPALAAVTAGLWAAWFAMRTAGTLLDGVPPDMALLTGVRLALCMAGAGLCLAMGAGLGRSRGLATALRIVVAIGLAVSAAIVWSVLNWLGFWAGITLAGHRWGAAAPDARAHTTVVVWLFVAWAAAWLAFDRLAETPAPSAELDRDLWAPSRNGLVRIPIDSVDWLEAERDYVRIHAGSASHLSRQPLHRLLERLEGEPFLRVHRSAAVNIRRIASIERGPHGVLRIALMNGRTTPVGRRYAPAVRALMERAALV